SFSRAWSSDVCSSDLVPSAKLSLGAEGEPTGAVAAPDAGSVQFTVADANGRTVREFSVSASKAGEVAFAWDGNDHTGQRLPAGRSEERSAGTGTETRP